MRTVASWFSLWSNSLFFQPVVDFSPSLLFPLHNFLWYPVFICTLSIFCASISCFLSLPPWVFPLSVSLAFSRQKPTTKPTLLLLLPLVEAAAKLPSQWMSRRGEGWGRGGKICIGVLGGVKKRREGRKSGCVEGTELSPLLVLSVGYIDSLHQSPASKQASRGGGRWGRGQGLMVGLRERMGDGKVGVVGGGREVNLDQKSPDWDGWKGANSWSWRTHKQPHTQHRNTHTHTYTVATKEHPHPPPV